LRIPDKEGDPLTIQRVTVAAVLVLALAGIGAFGWPGFLRGPGSPRGVIAYQGRVAESGYRLFTIRADGKDLHRLPVSIPNESFAFPAYSSDGKRLSFVGEAEGGRQDLFVAAANGSHPVSIVPSPLVQIGAASWSPDGATLVFSWKRDGDWEIFTVHADGTALTKLTSDRGFHGGAVFSPDGKTIVFTSDRGGADSHLFAMNPDGSGVRQLTFGQDESAADFSPDGRTIAYVGFTGGNADLWTMNADGTGRRRLTTDPMFEYDPRWSPDGRWIAFEGYRGDFPDLYVIRAGGSGRRQLTNTGRYAGNPAWIPGRN